ncbi:hypothetical protein GXM_03695 [Nostoc sphaeroides CCNUC1]|uniref:Uncharacterized protein n=1 Tax=Nostoc sphaeroides CCNUC1 TaxID=2653204 RepID=A0A5P8W0G8_9NOSO|nr:hypothetical protein GXM_03695 [Nostoc sphaeroides CCNUC1]
MANSPARKSFTQRCGCAFMALHKSGINWRLKPLEIRYQLCEIIP